MGATGEQRGGVVRRALAVGALACGLLGSGAATAGASAPAAGPDLYLVALEGPGVAGYDGPLSDEVARLRMTSRQNLLLDAVDAAEPVYRWTTALNGFAVRLTPAQVAALGAEPAVARVERNAVRPRAGAPVAAAGAMDRARTRGGAGVVIGVVDTGIHPESPLFSDTPGLGHAPRGFTGGCGTGEDWDADACNRKLVGAAWFVDGFGVDALRSASSLSPRDDDGHGTQMASIAAGNRGVSVRVQDQRLGRYGGVAPSAHLAAYKACWSAPDPDDDGCATADLVSAVDQAVGDGVDVLNLSVGGPPLFDVLELSLLGAAEADVVVVAAAGNAGRSGYAAHPSPWVTTVGGTTGAVRQGRVLLGTGPVLTGEMASSRAVGPTRLVVGAAVAADGSTREQARVCTPGSLDAAQVSGSVVLCDRGAVGRVDKSAAVAQADGAGMVLANVGPGSLDADFHEVPTVHVGAEANQVVRKWLARNPDGRVTLRPLGTDRSRLSVMASSSGGDPDGAVVKPDVVAPAAGVLGAVPPEELGPAWDFVSGTSAAAAHTSGAAAVLRQRHGWPAATVRSALTTTATAIRASESVLRSGAGRVRPERAVRPGLVHVVAPSDYRAWLDGTLTGELNTPSIVVPERRTEARRTVTNTGRRAMYFSSSATGFGPHSVRVTPAALRLAPGASATYVVTVTRSPGAVPVQDGWVTWRSADGTRTRIAVLLAR